jgi:hypothetical protein
MMTDELKEIVRSVRALARHAGVAARKLEAHRTVSVPHRSAAGMTGLTQIAQASKDFHGSIEAAFSALHPDTRKSFD